ncbi:imidazole glycerol phosphate synthase subunit HisH [Chloroflexota bacterium]
MIAIVDYGAGNIRSVVNAVSKLGYQPLVTSHPEEILNAQAVILPGVGAAVDTMTNLKALELANPIRQLIVEDKPFLGICIGMQILFTCTEEGGWQECLDIIPGRVRKLPNGFKIPHMGWNQVKQKASHPIFKGIHDETNFYFVHSYYVEPEDDSIIIGETEYGINFCSMLAKGNLVATQFHPEKSGEFGLMLYSNFIKMALAAKTSGLQVNSLGEQ